jgi:hypothetical protein
LAGEYGLAHSVAVIEWNLGFAAGTWKEMVGHETIGWNGHWDAEIQKAGSQKRDSGSKKGVQQQYIICTTNVTGGVCANLARMHIERSPYPQPCMKGDEFT